jgi:type VI protein secretion system component VasF
MIETQRVALQERVRHYVGQQYRVVSQTDTTAQLIKAKRFSLVWFLIWCCTVVGWLGYLFYHLFLKRERQVYLMVDSQGRVTETRDKR